LANELDVTSDFLMDGSMDDKAQDSISDKELLSQFQRIANMDNDKKMIVKELLEVQHNIFSKTIGNFWIHVCLVH
jgi:hypothetical protein